MSVQGRTLTLSNLDKVLYPRTGTIKAEVLDYYRRIAPVLLPHLADRPLTMVRCPDGVDGQRFYNKNAPAHRPDWVTTARLPSPRSTRNRETIDYVVVDDLPTLMWVANLAALELHTPMWRVSDGRPDLIVADLDPGPPATVVECARVALLLRDLVGELLGDAVGPLCVKTSGSKGLQVYGRVAEVRTGMQVREDMRKVATTLARQHPELIVANMRRTLREGKVLVDWSQNHPAKTTVSVYSLRAQPSPTVSTPVTWEEVAACRHPEELVFMMGVVPDRVEEHGDLFASLLDPTCG